MKTCQSKFWDYANKVIRREKLRDGDIIELGPFSTKTEAKKIKACVKIILDKKEIDYKSKISLKNKKYSIRVNIGENEQKGGDDLSKIFQQ